MIEIWRTIKYFPDYAISNLGRVKRIIIGPNTFSGRILKSDITKFGYKVATLYRNGKSFSFFVHRLVLEMFIGPRPENHECNHKDGNKKNNCPWNLEWVTKSENIIHAYRTGLKIPYERGDLRGEKNNRHKLKEGEVLLIRKLYDKKVCGFLIAKMFKITPGQIYHIGKRREWTHI